jgi:RND superfamily putative drug exporter
MLRRLASTCYHRRWRVLGAWIVLLVISFAAFGAAGEYKDEFKLPDSESADAFDFMESHGFVNEAGFGGKIVFRAEQGVDDPAVREAMEALFAQFAAELPDTTVISPYEEGNESQISESSGGTIAFAEIQMADRDPNDLMDDGKVGRELAETVQVDGLQVELEGYQFAETPEFGSEAIGFLAAIIILLVAFGSVLAMGLPLITALFGILTGSAIVGIVANVITMPSFTSQSVAMIAIGVGIDYALFIVTRYREGLHNGMEPEEAVVAAIDTSGRAVLFAGTTVIIAVLGLFAMGMSIMNGLAVGIVFGVLMTMLAALTLLPAILGFAGRNIDKLGLPHRKRAEGATRESFWFRWSHFIQRQPWLPFIGGAAVLILIALPVFGMRLGWGDAGNMPEDNTNRQAYDLLSEGFGPGFNGPFLLAADLPGGEADLAAFQGLVDELRERPEVAFIADPRPNEAGDGAIAQLFPSTSPQDADTDKFVHTLRDDIVPAAVEGSTADVMVGGFNPSGLDFANYMGSRLPLFMAAVLILSFLLLMAVFRSLVVPLKAVVMNLLSIGAAYGVLVAVFQWGWGKGLIGLGKEGPIDAWVPMMLFAILFGLSMDYEVFLLSRIKEDYDRTKDNANAVANGLAATARVITAAAAIMICVFGAFVLGDDRSIKLFGLGLAVAVFFDATIVRLILVPATMELLGDRNWWLPKWLDRILPQIHVEAHPEDHHRVAPAAGD